MQPPSTSFQMGLKSMMATEHVHLLLLLLLLILIFSERNESLA